MIFYFSGTGNSKYAALKIAETQNDKLISIGNAVTCKEFNYNLDKDESVGFVFPVYAWGPPSIVIEFINKIKITSVSKIYTYVLCTCGDDSGLTERMIKKVLENNSIEMNAFFSIVMPNNYIIGFQIDPEDIQNKKIIESNEALEIINNHISNRDNIILDNHKGSFSFAKSRFINPLFNKFMTQDKNFLSNDKCIDCKACEKVCPNKNISVLEGKVKWHNNCSMCLACINLCPVNAIEYGNSTKGKERYQRFKNLMITD